MESFKYRVDGSHPRVTVRISQFLMGRLLKGLTWSVAWGLVGFFCLRAFGVTLLSLAALVFCLLLTFAGLVAVSFSASWNTVWLSPDTLKWREIRPFAWHIRSFPLIAVRDFGFGIVSHGGPALRMDVDGAWYLLAEGIREEEATALLRDINEHGMKFPLDPLERQEEVGTSTPRFWTS